MPRIDQLHLPLRVSPELHHLVCAGFVLVPVTRIQVERQSDLPLQSAFGLRPKYLQAWSNTGSSQRQDCKEPLLSFTAQSTTCRPACLYWLQTGPYLQPGEQC